MEYKIEISGGLLGGTTILEGQLNGQHEYLRQTLLSEKRILNLNPNQSVGYKYLITLQTGRKYNAEFLFDETTLKGHFKELLKIAEVHSKVYQ